MSRRPVAGLVSRWESISAQERLVLRSVFFSLAMALVWFVGLAPAIRTVTALADQINPLNAQLQAVQQMAEQAKALQARPRLARADALRDVEALTTQKFGPEASVQAGKDKVVVTVKAVSSDSLISWLGQVRQKTGAALEQANLRQVASFWEGSLVVILPAGP